MNTRTPTWQRFLAAVGMIATSPVMIVAGLAVRISDGRPVLYRANRVGKNGKPFVMMKFRSMARNADQHGLISSASDARIFPVGSILRRTKVDELPQLFNVVRGEMALVGPRPEDPDIVERHYEPWMLESLTVPPGITSPGSLRYFETETSLPNSPAEAEAHYSKVALPRKITFDLVYVRHRSTGYDLNVIFRTLLGLFGNHSSRSSFTTLEEKEAPEILELNGYARGSAQ